jgi:MoaA/NifB/PqqE/SkfB family radical SAM enzyme
LKWVKEAKEQHHTNDPVVRLNYTMMRRNIEELRGVREFVQEYGIQILQLRHVKLTGAFSSLFRESLYFHQELSDQIMAEVKGRFDHDPERRLIHPPLFSGRVVAVARKSICAYPWFNFVIASNADLHMCNIGRIGNFHEQSFAQMLGSEQVKRVRKDLLRGRYEGYCRSCHTISDMDNVTTRDTFICEASAPSTVPAVISVRQKKTSGSRMDGDCSTVS